MMEEESVVLRASAPALVRPCLEKISQQVVGRKFAKLQEDVQSLLARLDTLLVVCSNDGGNSGSSSSSREIGKHCNDEEKSEEKGSSVQDARETDDEVDMSGSESSAVQQRFADMNIVGEAQPLADGAARGESAGFNVCLCVDLMSSLLRSMGCLG